MPQVLEIKTKNPIAQMTKVDSNIKDLSFSNLFWKKLSVRLAILLVISLTLLFGAQHIITKQCHESVEAINTKLALDLAQLKDSDMAEWRQQTAANVLVASAQEELESNPFVSESSMALYNVDDRSRLTTSYEIPVLRSDDAIRWWRSKANVDTGDPMIFMDDEIRNFCEKYESKTIHVDRLLYLNELLYLGEISAIDKSGKVIDSLGLNVASIAVEYNWTEAIEMEIIGNSEEDVMYRLMSEYKFVQLSENGDQRVEIKYNENIYHTPATILSTNFTINETDYQLDCGYQISFWRGAALYVVLIEMLCIAMCALFAYLNTKEALSIFR